MRRIQCLVALAGLAAVAEATTKWTQDGRRCLNEFDIGGGVMVKDCVPYKDTGVLWCRAEPDGFWGACAEYTSQDERAREEFGDRGDFSSSTPPSSVTGGIGNTPSYPETRLSPPPPLPSPPPPPPSPRRLREPQTTPRCVARSNIRWESPQPDGTSEYGMDIYIVLSSGRDIDKGWNVVFNFESDDVALYSGSAYGATARTVRQRDGRVFELRDRGYDAYISLYSTKRIGFNVRTRSGKRGLSLSNLTLNRETCRVVK